MDAFPPFIGVGRGKSRSALCWWTMRPEGWDERVRRLRADDARRDSRSWRKKSLMGGLGPRWLLTSVTVPLVLFPSLDFGVGVLQGWGVRVRVGVGLGPTSSETGVGLLRLGRGVALRLPFCEVSLRSLEEEHSQEWDA